MDSSVGRGLLDKLRYAGTLGAEGILLSAGGLLFALRSQNVRVDLEPSSALMQTHNGNLGPDTFATNRWPLVYQLSDNRGLLWKGLLPINLAATVSAEIESAVLFPAMYEYFRDYWSDPPHPLESYWEEGAPLWLSATSVNLSSPFWWCEAIGAAGGFPTCNGNDGLIPASRQVWPGGNGGAVITGSVRHLDETRHIEFLVPTIDFALRSP
ncbi:MAG: hypothetical protein MUF00_09890 [Gemmatimonadaceae bacterium]|nr:hypothetical protein [Gemmatimonadaceae bacterium]